MRAITLIALQKAKKNQMVKNKNKLQNFAIKWSKMVDIEFANMLQYLYNLFTIYLQIGKVWLF